MYSLLRRALFTLDAEVAHERTAALLKFASQTPLVATVLRQLFVPATRGLGQTVAGLTFAHPIGLAAGFDKHADLTHGMALLGFSHVEVGTVTPRPQPGNSKPRVFRLVEDQALINRLGFNSEGKDIVAPRLAKRPSQLPIGVNIGKNRDTALADATADYLSAFITLAPHADYIAVNISSPNTPGLRQLHEATALRELLDTLQAANQWQRPIFLKISPDESLAQLEQVIATALTAGVSGIIATNTTLDRPNLHSSNANEAGGLSGVPLRSPAMTTLRHVARLTEGKVPIISVGGISSAQDVYDRLRAGASLVQLYTALVYRGPAVVAQLSWGLAALLRRDGVSDIKQIIGIDRHLPA